MTRRAGVTLPEIMVCIAIIAVLAALLIPAGQQSVKAAKSTVCTSNLRQYYLALQLYRQDHDSYPPRIQSHPALATYGLSNIHCPEAKRGRDYWLFWPRDDKTKVYERTLWDCAVKRSGEFPLMFDLNHFVGSLGRVDDKVGHVLILRENGSIHKLPSSQAGVKPGPCDSKILPPLLHL